MVRRRVGRRVINTRNVAVNDELVAAVFNDPDHRLNTTLRARFGSDQGTGTKVLSGSKADFRHWLNILKREGKL